MVLESLTVPPKTTSINEKPIDQRFVVHIVSNITNEVHIVSNNTNDVHIMYNNISEVHIISYNTNNIRIMSNNTNDSSVVGCLSSIKSHEHCRFYGSDSVWRCSVEMQRAFWERRSGVTMKLYLYFERIVVVGLHIRLYCTLQLFALRSKQTL